MTKRFRVVWVDTGSTVAIVEAETEQQAIAEAIRNTEVATHEVRAYEVGPGRVSVLATPFPTKSLVAWVRAMKSSVGRKPLPAIRR